MRGTPARTPDRRVLRTRVALREAMISLILERGWEGFGVQDVCDRANVARSTFYLHYSTKDDLLAGNFDLLKKALRTQVLSQGSPGPGRLASTRGVIAHAHENQRLFRAVVGKRTAHVVQKRFRKVVTDLIREDLAGTAHPGRPPEAVVQFLAGAFVELLSWWLGTRSPLQPDAIDDLFHELAASAIAPSVHR